MRKLREKLNKQSSTAPVSEEAGPAGAAETAESEQAKIKKEFASYETALKGLEGIATAEVGGMLNKKTEDWRARLKSSEPVNQLHVVAGRRLQSAKNQFSKIEAVIPENEGAHKKFGEDFEAERENFEQKPSRSRSWKLSSTSQRLQRCLLQIVLRTCSKP